MPLQLSILMSQLWVSNFKMTPTLFAQTKITIAWPFHWSISNQNIFLNPSYNFKLFVNDKRTLFSCFWVGTTYGNQCILIQNDQKALLWFLRNLVGFKPGHSVYEEKATAMTTPPSLHFLPWSNAGTMVFTLAWRIENQGSNPRAVVRRKNYIETLLY
jgi:hypothetical protein